jgi:flagellar biosynthetic protein FlhB
VSGGGGGGDKTEKPTAKKLREARKEGRIARSPDVAQWATMLVAASLLPRTVRGTVSTFRTLFTQVPDLVAKPDADAALHMMREGFQSGALALAPLVGALMAVGLASNVAQGGLRPAMKKIKPDLKRMSIGKGIKRLLGPQGLLLGGKAVVKVGVLALVAYLALRSRSLATIGNGSMSLGEATTRAAESALHLIRVLAVTGLVLAAFDYLIEKRRHDKSLKMTKQQVKEEYKQSEGDPHMKGAIRSKQIAMSRNRMIASVADADVVLVNPTHVAVALAYTPGKGAPKVLAKGAGVIAAKIREEADKHRVPMVQDIPLARGLYAACEVGDEIPAELYDAVARVLAFLFSLRRRGRAMSGIHRTPALTAAAS